MNHPKLGYVIADGGRAKLILRHGSGRYETLAELEGDEHHRPSHDTRTRVFQSAGRGRAAVGREDADRERLVGAFVDEVEQTIQRVVSEGGFDRFVLAAPPRVLGVIRARLTPELQRRVLFEIAKDLTKLPDPELHSRLDHLSLL